MVTGTADLYYGDAGPEEIRFGQVTYGPTTTPAWYGTRDAARNITGSLTTSGGCAFELLLDPQ